MKIGLKMVLLLFMVFIAFLPFPYDTYSADVSPKLKVLEIIDSGTTQQLQPILGDTKYEYTTMTMKKFVAIRDELDGKFDMIAIMAGGYTAAGVSGKTHNTTNVMNDITNLKADEIIQKFIEKGQPVILAKNSIGSPSVKLRAKFNSYLSSGQNNILIYDTTYNIIERILGITPDSKLINQVNNFYANYSKLRPRFTLPSMPSETTQYKPGDTLSFTVDVQVPTNVSSRDLKAQLYIDSDFNDRYDASEIVKEVSINSKTSAITYQLPRGYSGLRYWKLELIDAASGLKDYEKGIVNFVDQTVELKVLQVTKNINDTSALTKSSIMTQSFLAKQGEYKINIDVTDITNFNKSKTESSGISHEVINGKYDMVIFGFADSYNNTALNTNSVNSLKRFIASEQSIMFTHDTIFNSNNLWVNNFMEATGQIAPQTDLGLNAPHTSTETKKVNEGIITNYPYVLGDNISIASTHNQYYTLKLEDPEVIPWYNIKSKSNDSDKRDENDSWNHYYTYSKGNITYSGTGHTSTAFPVEEQKLFVNTMYRAFLGSNHAPVITVISPRVDQLIPTNQKIELSYTIQDFDLKDAKVSTKVKLNGRDVYAQDNVTNGSTIVTSIDHGMTNDGVAKIEISAVDAKGATATKEITVQVVKLQTNLQVNRTINPSGITRVNNNIDVNYTITPQEITGKMAEAISGDKLVLTNVVLNEAFPAGIDVQGSGTKNGTVSSGIAYSQTLENVVYQRSGTKFIAQPFTFTVTIKPTKKEDSLVINNSVLSYKNANNQSESVVFNPLTIVAKYGLDSIQFPTNYELSRGVNKNFRNDLIFNPSDAGIRDITWREDSNGTILELDPSGSAQVKAAGSTNVTVTVTDVFGTVKVASAYVTVRIPVNSFTVTDIELNIGETKPLPISVTPEDARDSLEIKIDDEKVASKNKQGFAITGNQAGSTLMHVFGIDKDGIKTERIARITVKEIPVESISVSPAKKYIDKMGEFDIEVTINPSNATNKDVSWSIDDPKIIRILSYGKIEGIGTGKAYVTVTSSNGKTARVEVNVGQPLLGIKVDPSIISIEKGKTAKIASYLKYVPEDATNVISKNYSTSNKYYVSVESDGTFKGERIGTGIITITVTDDKDQTFSTQLTVKVVEPGSGVNDGSSLY